MFTNASGKVSIGFTNITGTTGMFHPKRVLLKQYELQKHRSVH